MTLRQMSKGLDSVGGSAEDARSLLGCLRVDECIGRRSFQSLVQLLARQTDESEQVVSVGPVAHNVENRLDNRAGRFLKELLIGGAGAATNERSRNRRRV